MIIFDLDGTLADCEHRRHFVDPRLNLTRNGDATGSWENGWKPDWEAFYQACDQDKPIQPVMGLFKHFYENSGVQIWSGRSESVRNKTVEWLNKNLGFEACKYFIRNRIKMRPIGDSTPDDVLKEQWLDEALAQGSNIDYVFDDRPKVIRMWRRRGIFVFNCCQHDKEF